MSRPEHDLHWAREQLPRFFSPEISTYSHFNSGTFNGGNHIELAHGEPILNTVEQVAVYTIDQLLRRHQPVIVVDVGAQFGLSLAIIGKHFSEFCESGQLRLLATVKEKRFSIDRALEEAKRRFQFIEIHKQLHQINVDPNDKNAQKTREDLLFYTKVLLQYSEWKFLSENNFRVQYFAGVDTTQIQEVLDTQFRGAKADIIHEFFGGIEHHPNKRKAIESICCALSPVGTLLTHADIDLNPATRLICECHSLSPRIITPGYDALHGYYAFIAEYSPLQTVYSYRQFHSQNRII